MRYCIALLFLVALSACGSEPDTPAEIVETNTEPAPVTRDDSPAAATDPVEVALDNRIPTRFHGVWDYVNGTCARESDLRMEISGSEILFYESIGQVTGVVGEGDEVIVTLAMEGEGETWEQATRLVLVGSGSDQRLETTDGELPRVADEFPSKRCPA